MKNSHRPNVTRDFIIVTVSVLACLGNRHQQVMTETLVDYLSECSLFILRVKYFSTADRVMAEGVPLNVTSRRFRQFDESFR